MTPTTLFALIIISCGHGDDRCTTAKTYYPTEEDCGVAAKRVKERLERDKPAARVVYYCQEQITEGATQ